MADDLDLVKFVGRLGFAVGDGADADEDPDIIWCDGGTVRLTPLITDAKVTGSATPWLAAFGPIDLTLSDGYLMWNGEPYIWLDDLGDGKTNPTINPGYYTHRVDFIGITAGGTSVKFATRNVRISADTATDPAHPTVPMLPADGGVCDLAVLSPVLAAGVSPITQGTPGLGIVSIAVDTSNLVTTMTDGSTLTAPVEAAFSTGLPGAVSDAQDSASAAATSESNAADSATAAQAAQSAAETAASNAQTVATGDIDTVLPPLLDPTSGSNISTALTEQITAQGGSGGGAPSVIDNGDGTLSISTGVTVSPDGNTFTFDAAAEASSYTKAGSDSAISAAVAPIKDLSDPTFSAALSAAIDARTAQQINALAPAATASLYVPDRGLASLSDPFRHDSTRLRVWRDALASAKTAPANILAIGDSWSSGNGASAIPATRFLDQLRTMLRARFNPAGVAGGENYWPSYNASGGYQNPITYAAGTGSITNQTTFGLGRAVVRIAGGGGTATFTFTGTGADIVYAKGATGSTFTWHVDGGAESAPINTSQGTAQGGNVVQIRGLSVGSHNVVVTATGASVYLEGFVGYNGDESAGVRMYASAFTGYRSSDFIDSSGFTYQSYAVANPHLVMIELGINDYGGGSAGVTVPPATLASNLTALIAAVRANTTTNPSIVLWLPPQTVPTKTPSDTWANYLAAIEGVATADGKVALFDAQTLGFNGQALSASADPNGIDLGDHLHPNPKGHAALAYALYRLLADEV